MSDKCLFCRIAQGELPSRKAYEDEEILAFLNHGREILQRHIGASTGIIEPPVRVFLDGGGLV